MRRFALFALFLCGCTTPPAPLAPRSLTAVNAPFSRTWDAVIDVFADRNIPIATMDRASGFIAARPAVTGRADTLYADCGKAIGVKTLPTAASYNLVVRGDSTRSTVKMTISFTQTSGEGAFATNKECTSRGTLEAAVEQQIKAKAEGT